MTISQLEIQIIACLVAASCAIPGVFLLLRKMSMMSDAISHSILLGIVVAFLYIGNLASPLLIIGAALSGLITVFLVETVNRKQHVSRDAAIGLIFPFLFSIGIVLIALFARSVHLDIHAVLLGEIAFAPFDRLYINDSDLGPKSFYVMGTILLLNILFVSLFYKELKLSTFDHSLAESFRFYPNLLNTGLMTIVSITCVGAFDSVGSILVIAFIIVPPCCAYLLTGSLSKMILLSILIGIACSITGFWLAIYLNANIAGSIAVVAGIAFSAVFIFAPEKGILSQGINKWRQKWEFAHDLLLVHLHNHEGSPDFYRESEINHLYRHMLWNRKFGMKVINTAQKRGNIVVTDNKLILTERGRRIAVKFSEIS